MKHKDLIINLLGMLGLGIICFLVMLPRIRSAQFGLLDDGVTIEVTRVFLHDPAKAFSFMRDSGRFFPAFWLARTIIYALAQISARKWFLVYALLLVAETFGIFWYVRMRASRFLQAFLSGLLFSLSGPVIECFYTLSKAETFVVLWMIAGLLCAFFYARVSRLWAKIVFAGFAFLFLSIAALSKETTIVLIPVFLAWAALARWKRLSIGDNGATSRTVLLASAAVAAGVAFFGLRSLSGVAGLSQGGYASNYQLDALGKSAAKWAGMLIRDDLYLLPLFFLPIVPGLRKRLPVNLLFEMLIFMGGWAAVYMPWWVIQEYFLLPFSLGASMVGGSLLGAGLEYLWSPREHSVSQMFALSAVSVALLLFLVTLVNNRNNANMQLVFDRANFELERAMSHLPQGSQVAMNLPEDKENITEMQAHMAALRGRADIQVVPFHFQNLDGPGMQAYYVATPRFSNQTFPSVRVSPDEDGASRWNACLDSFLQDKGEQVFLKEVKLDLLDFGLHRLIKPAYGKDIFGFEKRPVVDGRTMTYGWAMYRVEVTPGAYPGVFMPDGKWILQRPGQRSVEVRFGQPGDRPITGDWNGDGWTEIGTYRPGDRTWRLDANLDGQADQSFTFEGMQAGDLPLSGDWDGDGVDTPGYYRPGDQTWHLKNAWTSGRESLPVFEFGSSEDIPLAGDWNADGHDEVGKYHPKDGSVVLRRNLLIETNSVLDFQADPGAAPVSGGWTGFGVDTLAFVTGGRWVYRPYNADCNPANPPEPVEFPTGDGVPVAGRWK